MMKLRDVYVSVDGLDFVIQNKPLDGFTLVGKSKTPSEIAGLIKTRLDGINLAENFKLSEQESVLLFGENGGFGETVEVISGLPMFSILRKKPGKKFYRFVPYTIDDSEVLDYDGFYCLGNFGTSEFVRRFMAEELD